MENKCVLQSKYVKQSFTCFIGVYSHILCIHLHYSSFILNRKWNASSKLTLNKIIFYILSNSLSKMICYQKSCIKSLLWKVLLDTINCSFPAKTNYLLTLNEKKIWLDEAGKVTLLWNSFSNIILPNIYSAPTVCQVLSIQYF